MDFATTASQNCVLHNSRKVSQYLVSRLIYEMKVIKNIMFFILFYIIFVFMMGKLVRANPFCDPAVTVSTVM